MRTPWAGRWRLNSERMSWIATLAAALITTTLYFRTVHPGVGPYLDSVEYQLATLVLGVSHPPGHPLYTWLGRLFIALASFGNPAFRLNLFSAVCSVGAVALILRLSYRLTRSIPLALLGALALGGAVRFWYQALYTEVYALYNLFVAAELLALVAFMQTRKRWLYFLGTALYALSFGANALAIFLLPMWLWAVLATDPRLLTRPRNLTLTAGIVLVAAAQYLYIPVRAFQHPPFCNYCPENWAEVPAFLLGQPFSGFLFGVQSQYLLQRWADSGYQLMLQFWPIGVMLGAIGLWHVLLREPRIGVLFLLGIGAHWLFVVSYDVVDWSDFMTTLYVLYAPLIALGAGDVWNTSAQWMAGWSGRRRVLRGGVLTALAASMTGLLVATFVNNYPLVDQSQKHEWHAWARQLLDQMEPDAWLLTPPTPTDGFAQSWALRYVSWSENRVPGLQVVYVPGLEPPGPPPGYLRYEEALPHLAEHPVYVVDLNDDRLRAYALLPISREDGWTIGYRVVGQRAADGTLTPWVSAERWAEISSRVVLP
ncbi:MAG TPA: DUF2723 domain-containing protein [Anaerolineae bacterium]